MMLRTAIAVLAAAVVIGVASGAWCAGGVYVDNVRVTNDGQNAFLDNFDTGKLVGWTNATTAQVVCDRSNCSMLLNKHVFCAAGAFHPLAIENPGVVDTSMDLYVTPAAEQYDCHKKNLPCIFYITLYSSVTTGKRTDDILGAGLSLAPNAQGCNVGFKSNKQCLCKSWTTTPVVPAGQWVTLTFRLDAVNGRATIFVNARQVISIPYDRGPNPPVRQIGLCCGFGDGSKRTD
jgi:hypothetical protein